MKVTKKEASNFLKPAKSENLGLAIDFNHLQDVKADRSQVELLLGKECLAFLARACEAEPLSINMAAAANMLGEYLRGKTGLLHYEVSVYLALREDMCYGITWRGGSYRELPVKVTISPSMVEAQVRLNFLKFQQPYPLVEMSISAEMSSTLVRRET